jgi:hypothetical protein
VTGEDGERGCANAFWGVYYSESRCHTNGKKQPSLRHFPPNRNPVWQSKGEDVLIWKSTINWSQLENEVKVLKNEVQAVLLDLGERYLDIENPFSAPQSPATSQQIIIDRQSTANEPTDKEPDLEANA